MGLLKWLFPPKCEPDDHDWTAYAFSRKKQVCLKCSQLRRHPDAERHMSDAQLKQRRRTEKTVAQVKEIAKAAAPPAPAGDRWTLAELKAYLEAGGTVRGRKK